MTERRATMGLDDPPRLALALDRFEAFVREHALNNKFYRNLWTESGQNCEEVPRRPELLPIVTKAQLRNGLASKDILNSQHDQNKAVWLKTTGSTGEPFVFPINPEGVAMREASRILAREGYGHQIGDTIASLWRGKFGKLSLHERLVNWLHGETRVCIYDPECPVESSLSDARLNEILSTLEEIDPTHIDGYASAISLLARFHLNAKRVYFGRNLRTVITGAEVLADTDRSYIEDFFRVPVINRYGGTECSIIAHQFLDNDGEAAPFLRVCNEKVLVELVDESGSYVDAGELGRIIVTDFTNTLMPLIRFDIGDFARGLSKGVQYGLTEIVGRRNSFFRNKNGNLISTHIWQNYLRSRQEIDSFLMEQKKDLDVCLYLKLRDCQSDEMLVVADLKQKIERALPGSEVSVKCVENIPPGPGGKHIQCISYAT